jgi:hypothetical protein
LCSITGWQWFRRQPGCEQACGRASLVTRRAEVGRPITFVVEVGEFAWSTRQLRFPPLRPPRSLRGTPHETLSQLAWAHLKAVVVRNPPGASPHPAHRRIRLLRSGTAILLVALYSGLLLRGSRPPPAEVAEALLKNPPREVGWTRGHKVS